MSSTEQGPAMEAELARLLPEISQERIIDKQALYEMREIQTRRIADINGSGDGLAARGVSLHESLQVYLENRAMHLSGPPSPTGEQNG